MTAKSSLRLNTGSASIVAACALVLVGCSAPTQTPAAPESLDIALFSDPQGVVVPLVYGVDNYGDAFDLAISADRNVTIFEDHTSLIDTARAGDIQVMATSVSAILDAREEGEDLKIFCPYVGVDDFVLAGANGVTTVDQLFQSTTRVGVDSPGGASAIVLNALLSGVGETRDIPDIPNQLIIESSRDRTAEWASGALDATVIH